jgi:hypothetical protein
MNRIALLAFGVLLSGCSYTGDALRDAGAGGTSPGVEAPHRAPAIESAESNKQDARFQEPIRPGTGRVSVK